MGVLKHTVSSVLRNSEQLEVKRKKVGKGQAKDGDSCHVTSDALLLTFYDL